MSEVVFSQFFACKIDIEVHGQHKNLVVAGDEQRDGHDKGQWRREALQNDRRVEQLQWLQPIKLHFQQEW